jgi:uncharacterized protein
MTHSTTQFRPAWYREPWPWLLMAGPAAVIVAGAITTWLAVAHRDDLVVDDYYKQGLAINRVIEKEAAAQTIGVDASVSFAAGRAVVRLHGDSPPALVLRLVHVTRAAEDRLVRLHQVAAGRYEGQFVFPLRGHWHLVLEDATARWRLTGEWDVADGPSVILLPEATAELP